MDAITEILFKNLAPNILSMEMIEKEKLVPENLFELKIGHDITGPFSGPFLKTFLAGKEIENLMVKNLESIIWIPIHQHAYFFTGDVKPTSLTEAERREFYLLVNGRKIGPYKTEDIEYKFKNGELLFTDLISEDEGRNWCKVYEMSHVDLRRHIGSELPPTPSKIDQTPIIVPEVQEQIGIVGDLVKVGIDGEKEKSKRIASLEPNRPEIERPSSRRIGNLLILAAFIILGFYLFSNRESFFNLEKEAMEKFEGQGKSLEKVTPLKTNNEKKRVNNLLPPENIVPRNKINRPPRYPVAPGKETMESLPDSIVDEAPPEPDDNYTDEEVEKPTKPNPTRRRSRPKPIDDMMDEPADELVE